MTPQHVLTRDEVREIDRRAVEQFGMSSLVLMENAGRGCTEWMMRLGIRGRVTICAGKGNNGGDGFVIARHLENARHDVIVLLTCPAHELRGDALANYNILKVAGTPIHEWSSSESFNAWPEILNHADWIVDALLGTGMQGDVREPYRTAIALINTHHPARVLAVDIPSGMDCDTGDVLGTCIKASCTATFVALKPCFQVPSAEHYTGPVKVIDIGVPRVMWEPM
ncbi:MAG: NAD(P)H-hydrate epimerase [Planctomycetaceae bacterium]